MYNGLGKKCKFPIVSQPSLISSFITLWNSITTMDLENVCGKDGGAKYFYEQAKHPLKIPGSAEHRGPGGFISVGSFVNHQVKIG